MITKNKLSYRRFIIIIVLLMLSVFFTFSGAWFTASATYDNSNARTFRFGTIGDVTITANDYVWKNSDDNYIYLTSAAKTAANDNNGEIRTVVMPGDYLSSGSVELCYDPTSEATEDLVLYLIKIGNAYYTISSSPTNQLVSATTSAGLINAGTANKLVINGSIVSFSYNNTTYSLDGSNSSKAISDVYFQGKTLSQLGASFGNMSIAVGSTVYKVAIIQSANLTTTLAYDLLQDMLDSM